METPDNHNSKSLKVFIKGSLALIGLFFALSCGVAALLICSGKNIDINKNIEISKNIDKYYDNNVVDKNNETSKKYITDKKNVIVKNIEDKVFILIFFLVGLPILVFIIVFSVFSCLAKCYYEKIYNPSFNKHEFMNCKIHEEITRQMNKFNENFLETQKNEENHLNKRKIEVMGDVCLAVAKALKPDYEKNEEALQKLKDMLVMLSKIGLGEKESE